MTISPKHFRLTRGLNAHERTIATTVFGDTIPFWRVSISSKLGFGDRPWTHPDPGLLLLSLGGFATYTLEMGPEGYTHGMQTPDRAGTLIHELTHVWQGIHGDGFILGSVWSQATSRDAYAYKPGAPWLSYNVEQQAQIVEDWYVTGAIENDAHPLFPYVREVIRKPYPGQRLMNPFAPYHP